MPTPDERALPAPDGSTGLDPEDWDSFRSLAHRAVDDLVDHLAGRRDEPVWRPMPDDVRASFDGPLPRAPGGADAAYREVLDRVVPYSMGNDHPRFWGWYMGAGHPVGNLADLVASVINPNLGGADHSPVLVEQQVVHALKLCDRVTVLDHGAVTWAGDVADVGTRVEQSFSPAH